MPHGFDTYRVFISAPGDLDTDRLAAYDAISRANESTAMPAKILLASVGLRESGQIDNFRSAVSDNVRWSTYFIQIFQDDWGPRDLFRKLFLLALECRDNSSMPMRDVVVCLKDAPGETNSEIVAFRKEIEEREDITVFRYSGVEQLQKHIERVCVEWTESLIALGSPAPGVS
jgi:hypothetical protein